MKFPYLRFNIFHVVRQSPVVFRPKVGPLYLRRVIDERMEYCWSDNWQGKIDLVSGTS
jgi:hypothetical protein